MPIGPSDSLNGISTFDTNDIAGQEPGGRYFTGILPTAIALSAISLTIATPEHRRSLEKHRRMLSQSFQSRGGVITNNRLLTQKFMDAANTAGKGLATLMEQKSAVEMPNTSIYNAGALFQEFKSQISQASGLSEKEIDKIYKQYAEGKDKVQEDQFKHNLSLKSMKKIRDKINEEAFESMKNSGHVSGSSLGLKKETIDRLTQFVYYEDSLGNQVADSSSSRSNFQINLAQLEDSHSAMMQETKEHILQLQGLADEITYTNNRLEQLDMDPANAAEYNKELTKLNTLTRTKDELITTIAKKQNEIKVATEITAHSFVREATGHGLPENMIEADDTIKKIINTNVEGKYPNQVAINSRKKSLSISKRAGAILRATHKTQTSNKPKMIIGGKHIPVHGSDFRKTAIKDIGILLGTHAKSLHAAYSQIERIPNGNELITTQFRILKNLIPEQQNIKKQWTALRKAKTAEDAANAFAQLFSQPDSAFGKSSPQSNIADALNSFLIKVDSMRAKKDKTGIRKMGYGLNSKDHTLDIKLYGFNKKAATFSIPISYGGFYLGGEDGEILKTSLHNIQNTKYGTKYTTSQEKIFLNLTKAAEILAKGGDGAIEEAAGFFERETYGSMNAVTHQSQDVINKQRLAGEVYSRRSGISKDVGILMKKEKQLQTLNGMLKEATEKAKEDIKQFRMGGYAPDTPEYDVAFRQKVLDAHNMLRHGKNYKLNSGKVVRATITTNNQAPLYVSKVHVQISKLKNRLPSSGFAAQSEIVQQSSDISRGAKKIGIDVSTMSEVSAAKSQFALTEDGGAGTVSYVSSILNKANLSVPAAKSMKINKTPRVTVEWNFKTIQSLDNVQRAEAGAWAAFVDADYISEEGASYGRRRFVEKFKYRKQIEGTVPAQRKGKTWTADLNIGKDLRLRKVKYREGGETIYVATRKKGAEPGSVGFLRNQKQKRRRGIEIHEGDKVIFGSQNSSNRLNVKVFGTRTPVFMKGAAAGQAFGHLNPLQDDAFDQILNTAVDDPNLQMNKYKINRTQAIFSKKFLAKQPVITFVNTYMNTAAQIEYEHTIHQVRKEIGNSSDPVVIRKAVAKGIDAQKESMSKISNMLQNIIDMKFGKDAKSKRPEHYDVNKLFEFVFPSSSNLTPDLKSIPGELAFKLKVPNAINLENTLQEIAGNRELAGVLFPTSIVDGKEVSLDVQKEINKITKGRWLKHTTFANGQQQFYVNIHMLSEEKDAETSAGGIFDARHRKQKGGMPIGYNEHTTLAITKQAKLQAEHTMQIQQRRAMMERRFGWLYSSNPFYGMNLGGAAKAIWTPSPGSTIKATAANEILQEIIGGDVKVSDFHQLGDDNSTTIKGMVSKILSNKTRDISEKELEALNKSNIAKRFQAGILTGPEFERFAKIVNRANQLELAEPIMVLQYADPKSTEKIIDTKYVLKQTIDIPKNLEHQVTYNVKTAGSHKTVAVTNEMKDLLDVLVSASKDHTLKNTDNYMPEAGLSVNKMIQHGHEQLISQTQKHVFKTQMAGSMMKRIAPADYDVAQSNNKPTSKLATHAPKQLAMGVREITRTAAMESIDMILGQSIANIENATWRTYIDKPNHNSIKQVFETIKSLGNYKDNDLTKFNDKLKELATFMTENGLNPRYGESNNPKQQKRMNALLRSISSDVTDDMIKNKVGMIAMEATFPHISEANMSPVTVLIKDDRHLSPSKRIEASAMVAADIYSSKLAKRDFDGDLLYLLGIVDKDAKKQAFERIIRQRLIVREVGADGSIDYSKISKVHSGYQAAYTFEEHGSDVLLQAHMEKVKNIQKQILDIESKGEVPDVSLRVALKEAQNNIENINDSYLHANPQLAKKGGAYLSLRKEFKNNTSGIQPQLFGLSGSEVTEIFDKVQAEKDEVAASKNKKFAYSIFGIGTDTDFTHQQYDISFTNDKASPSFDELSTNVENMKKMSTTQSGSIKVTIKQGKAKHTTFLDGPVDLSKLSQERTAYLTAKNSTATMSAPFLDPTEANVIAALEAYGQKTGSIDEHAFSALEQKYKKLPNSVSNNELAALKKLQQQYMTYAEREGLGRTMEGFLASKTLTGGADNFQKTYASYFRNAASATLGKGLASEDLAGAMDRFLSEYQQNSIGGKHGLSPVTKSVIDRFQNMSLGGLAHIADIQSPSGKLQAFKILSNVAANFDDLWEGRNVLVDLSPRDINTYSQEFSDQIAIQKAAVTKKGAARDAILQRNSIETVTNQNNKSVTIETRISTYKKIQRRLISAIGIETQETKNNQASISLHTKTQEYLNTKLSGFAKTKDLDLAKLQLEKEEISIAIREYEKVAKTQALKNYFDNSYREEVLSSTISTATYMDTVGTKYKSAHLYLTSNEAKNAAKRDIGKIYDVLQSDVVDGSTIKGIYGMNRNMPKELAAALNTKADILNTADVLSGISKQLPSELYEVSTTVPGTGGPITARSAGEHISDIVGRAVYRSQNKKAPMPPMYSMAGVGASIIGASVLGFLAISAMMPSVLPGDSAGLGGEYYEHQKSKKNERGRNMESGKLLAEQLTYGKKYIRIKEDKWTRSGGGRRDNSLHELITSGDKSTPVYGGANVSNISAMLRR